MKQRGLFSSKIKAILLPVLLLIFQLPGLAQEAFDSSIWRGIATDGFPSTGWTVQNKVLTLAAGRKGGDLITKEKYGDFDLQLEYKLAPLANTGIKYFVELLTSGTKKKVTGIGLEFQLIDDFNHPEVKGNKHPEGSTGALYLLYAPQSNKKLNPVGQWNTVRILSRGKKVEHWLNGKKVLSYQRGSQKFKELVSSTKFKDYPDYGEALEGHILLQDHGDEASFRNIKLKRL